MIPNIIQDFDFNLGSTVEQLRESIRDFSAKEISPIADEIDKKNDFPQELWKKMGNWFKLQW